MNRYLHVQAKELLDGVTPTSTPTSLIPVNENIKKLIEVIGENQLSVKEMLIGMGLIILLYPGRIFVFNIRRKNFTDNRNFHFFAQKGEAYTAITQVFHSCLSIKD